MTVAYLSSETLKETADILVGWFPKLLTKSSIPPLRKEDFPDAPTYCKRLFEIEESFRDETDSAVRALIETGSLPADLSPWVHYFIFLRLLSAISFLDECGCEDLKGFPLAFIRQDHAYVCETLLCELWNKCRRDHWLKANVFSAYYELPLFGVVPAKPEL